MSCEQSEIKGAVQMQEASNTQESNNNQIKKNETKSDTMKANQN